MKAAESENPVAKDIARSIKPNGADVGSILSDIQKLAALHEFEYSFLGDRFSSLDEFKQASREKIFDALLYRPKPIAPRAEILERADLGDIIREKIVFSTTPEFRVPARNSSQILPKLAPRQIKGRQNDGGRMMTGWNHSASGMLLSQI